MALKPRVTDLLLAVFFVAALGNDMNVMRAIARATWAVCYFEKLNVHAKRV